MTMAPLDFAMITGLGIGGDLIPLDPDMGSGWPHGMRCLEHVHPFLKQAWLDTLGLGSSTEGRTLRPMRG
ncbi:hypothetical protein ACSBR2_010863 [Camellia fascicularis]